MACDHSDVAEVVDDGPRVRIVRYTLPAGGETGWHRHALDYVIVPYRDCRVRVELADGSSVEALMSEKAPYFREAGVHHNVTNLMSEMCSFLEIELKGKEDPSSC